MSEVWILFGTPPYETNYIIGIFPDKESADVMYEHYVTKHGERGRDYYDVQKWEVNKSGGKQGDSWL